MGENLHGLKPSLNVRDLKTLEIKYQSFHVLYVDLKKQIELVDEEIETTDLRKQLVPVEKSIQQMANLIEIFQQFMTLYEDIKQHQALTLTVISQSKEIHEQEDLSILEENLEVLLDHSDEVADHLDEIEKKGFSIQPLEKPYNSYIEELESFQDVLDETRQRLQERGV
jgi:chromosome segregation ATPase